MEQGNKTDNIEKGVVLTGEEIARSNVAKEKQRRGTAQLPAFRAASNLMFSIAQIMMDCPRKLSRYTDLMIADSSEISKSIALANESRGEECSWYISNAMSLLFVVRNYFVILERVGVLSKDRCNKLRSESDKLIAQLTAWRDFTSRQGFNTEKV